MTDDQLAAVVLAIDEINGDDPNSCAGQPRAQWQGQRAMAWTIELDPAPSVPVQVAARAHHLRRWDMPRSDFPAGRAGYLRWRRDAKQKHAALVSDVLRAHEWPDTEIDRVGALIERKGLGTDPETQLVEDAACLVFLETQFDEMVDRLGHDHMVQIVAKTLKKMSGEAISAAASIELSAASQAVLQEAITPPADETTPPTTGRRPVRD